MSDVIGELARVSTAFDQPTLKLLHQSHAAVVLSLFRTAFSRERRTMPAPALHTHVEVALGQLRAEGFTAVPTGTGRQLCQRWTAGQWLIRESAEDGTDVYSLTSHAQEALDVVRRMMRDRIALSEHRISTIVSAVRAFNLGANPDKDARIARIDEEIATLSAERKRLADGGDLPPVSADYLLEGYGELLTLVSGLPSDFARVEEAFNGLRLDILHAFRTEERGPGQVIDDYLQRADSLMSGTAEGRAFEGAFTLLRDDAVLLQLRQDLTALLNHPMVLDILTDSDQRELRGTVPLIRAGIEAVLTRRTRVTAALREYIVTHDLTRDRQLDALLRQLDGQLTTWLTHAGARATVPLALLPERVEVEHLRERFWDTATETPPPPLYSPEDDRPEAVTLAELLSHGGPSMDPLREELALAVHDPSFTTVADLFATFPDELRRPVEVAGLLHLITNSDDLARDGGRDVFDTVRPDGTHRALSGPRMTHAHFEQDNRL